MVQYVDNGCIPAGWYYVKEGCYYGNGTREEAERIEMERESDLRICQCCEKEVERRDMEFTRDFHGITFRLVCYNCYNKLMAKGYDGQYYSEADECLDEDY